MKEWLCLSSVHQIEFSHEIIYEGGIQSEPDANFIKTEILKALNRINLIRNEGNYHNEEDLKKLETNSWSSSKLR